MNDLIYRKQTIIHPLNSEKDENAMDKINRMYTGSFDSVGHHATGCTGQCGKIHHDQWSGQRQTQQKKLEYVNVSIPGSSVGTVTNADGEFTLKIPESVQAKDIEASHVGYLNSRIPLKEENPTERIVWLTPYANLLSEILVRARDPRSIVEEALRKIPANYSPQSNMLTGFYRELAQKGVVISIFQRL